MQILNSNELFDINGGALMSSPFYGFIKVLRWIAQLLKART